MLIKPQMILIDLDGTLIDSVPDLTYCVDEMMAALDLPGRGDAKVRNWVGNGIERLVRRALIDPTIRCLPGPIRCFWNFTRRTRASAAGSTPAFWTD